MITDAQLRQIMPNLKPVAFAVYLPHLQRAMTEFQINTPLRTAAFVAQLAHESQELGRFEENLNYSWQGLRSVFSKYFLTDAEAKAYERQPERIANRVYANRLGNGSESSGDGWKFRGRGPLQITGRSNYKSCGTSLGIDLVSNPARVAAPEIGFRIAGLFWRKNGLNELADQQKFEEITKRINGGLKGIAERRAYYERAKEILGVRGVQVLVAATEEQVKEKSKIIETNTQAPVESKKLLGKKGTVEM